MTTEDQYIISFGVDCIYGRQGCRFPTGELKLLVVATTMSPQNKPQKYAAITRLSTGKRLQSGIVNSIDNQ